jgi:diguanylate cyclase (GGDEF)-like protein
MLRPHYVLLLPPVVCLLTYGDLVRFSETAWFKALVLIAMVGVGFGISSLRLRRLKAAERQLVIRVTEATAELAAANRRLELLATTDELTRLANRRRFSEFLDQEWHRATRDHTSIALLMLDVDFFKTFNDTHGHQAGDECLRRVAAVIGGRVKRSSDLAARYGGEEFAVVLSGAEEEGAVSVAHWIRHEIENQQIAHGASRVSDYVTVSIGVAIAAPRGGVSAASLIADADAALYRAKELGRNAVVAGSAAARVI